MKLTIQTSFQCPLLFDIGLTNDKKAKGIHLI